MGINNESNKTEYSECPECGMLNDFPANYPYVKMARCSYCGCRYNVDNGDVPAMRKRRTVL